MKRTLDGLFYLQARFITKSFGSKATAGNLVEHIKQSFQSFPDWIRPSTKREAMNKLEKLSVKIGYPDLIFDDAKINHLYGGVDYDDDFLLNIVKGIANPMRWISRDC